LTLHNKEEKDIQKLYQAQKSALYWLLGLLYLGFIGMQLGRVQAITDFNYNLHEMMFFPVTIAVFAVPVVFLIYLYLIIKYALNRKRHWPSLKTNVQAVIIIASVVVVVSITAYQSQEVSTGGVFEVEQKIHENNKYFLVLNDKKVRVSSNEYHLVEENQEYLISFVWNKRSPNSGRLETIETLE
jgi:heme/copper-type cytochrome/quinol oxidase subunit 2